MADKPDALARSNCKIHPVKRANSAETLGDAAELHAVLGLSRHSLKRFG